MTKSASTRPFQASLRPLLRINVFNPAVLVLGGYFAALGEWLRGPLTSALATQVFAPNAGGCRIELSTLGFSAAVRGGALRALEPVFDDPTVVPA